MQPPVRNDGDSLQKEIFAESWSREPPACVGHVQGRRSPITGSPGPATEAEAGRAVCFLQPGERVPPLHSGTQDALSVRHVVPRSFPTRARDRQAASRGATGATYLQVPRCSGLRLCPAPPPSQSPGGVAA